MSAKKNTTASQELSNDIINTIHEPLIVLDQDLRVVTASRFFYDFFKVKPEETEGQFIYNLGNKQWDIPKLRELLKNILPQKITFDNYEVEHDFATIGRRIMLLNARQIHRVLGRERIILLVIEDITERKRGAKEKVNQLAAIVQSSEDAIIGKSLDGIITSWNKSAEKIYGYTEREAIGKSILFLIPPGNEDETPKILDRIKSGEKIEHYETVRRRKDGREIQMSLTISSVLNSEGKIIAASTIGRDITERKQAEEEIHKRTAQLEASNKELEAFTYSVSHDLRAPLRHIDGYVELLINRFHDALPEKGIHYLDTIADSARQMAALIDDLLQFSRTGRQEMRQAHIDMNLVLQEVLESINQNNTGRNIEWSIATLPNVYGDYAMLRLVWINLLNNAVKFTRKKEKAKIEVGCREDNMEYVFSVRDNGVGFDMQYAHKLFGVFQRLHSSEEFEGTGIGLANVRRIIAKHGGRTWAEAALDKGAVFYFTLLKNKEKKS